MAVARSAVVEGMCARCRQEDVMTKRAERHQKILASDRYSILADTQRLGVRISIGTDKTVW